MGRKTRFVAIERVSLIVQVYRKGFKVALGRPRPGVAYDKTTGRVAATRALIRDDCVLTGRGRGTASN
jgi:hypothetical protein